MSLGSLWLWFLLSLFHKTIDLQTLMTPNTDLQACTPQPCIHLPALHLVLTGVSHANAPNETPGSSTSHPPSLLHFCCLPSVLWLSESLLNPLFPSHSVSCQSINHVCSVFPKYAQDHFSQSPADVWKMVRDRVAWHAVVHGVVKS